MSWSLGVTVHNSIPAGGVTEGIYQLTELAKANPGNEQCPKERDDQIHAALAALVRLVNDSGLVENADEVTIALSGHANKDHEASAEWANEFITISLYAKSYRPKA